MEGEVHSVGWIDWVQDAARAQLQRRVQKRKQGYYVRTNWRRKLWLSYDAGQAWIVISLIGTHTFPSYTLS